VEKKESRRITAAPHLQGSSSDAAL
jgi:hypothetical protein